MALDTQAINQESDHLQGREDVWLFGYGSLIYKADFPFLEKQPASIQGWARRFWQGSHDHRGTPEAPGRVVTLVEAPDEVCGGMAYRVTPDVFAHLDHREKNGYLRLAIDMVFTQSVDSAPATQGLIYIAAADNAAYLGPASTADIVSQIARSHGPSGPNDEYALRLAAALQELNVRDPHVEAIARELQSQNSLRTDQI